MQPLHDRVILRRIELSDDKQVQVADAYRPRSNRGEVLGLGDKVEARLRVGDQVLFGEYSAQDIVIDGEELVLISVYDIWVKL